MAINKCQITVQRMAFRDLLACGGPYEEGWWHCIIFLFRPSVMNLSYRALLLCISAAFLSHQYDIGVGYLDFE
jgi:hypothetical protein